MEAVLREALAIVPEAAAVHHTLGLALVRMLAKAAEITSGKLLYTRQGSTRDILDMNKGELKAFRWQDCAMVFQGSQNAWNPVLRISEQFADTARAHGKTDRKWVEKRTLELFKLVSTQRVTQPHFLFTKNLEMSR